MSKTKIFRALALINFVVLLTIFLLYRNGAFDNMFRNKEETNITSQNDVMTNGKFYDSLPAKRDSLKNARTILTPKATMYVDTAKLKKTQAQAGLDSFNAQQERTMLSSSKSIPIVEPRFLDTPKKKWIPNPNTNPK